MNKFKVYDDCGEWYLIEAEGEVEACEEAAEMIYAACAGEIGTCFDLWCNGNVYEVEVEFEPVFTAGKLSPDDPGELEEHECCGEFGCWKCNSHRSKVRTFNRDRRSVEIFESIMDEI